MFQHLEQAGIPKEFVKWVYERFRDADTIDILGHFDSKLTLSELKAEYTKKFRNLYIPTKQEEKDEAQLYKEAMEQQKAEEERILAEMNDKEHTEMLERYRQKFSEGEINTPQFNLLKNKLRIVVKGLANSCFINGKYGTGKSYATIQILKRFGQEFVEIDYSPPLELIRLLWNHKNENVCIVFHESELLWKNPDTGRMLRRAVEDRIISWNTSEKYLDGMSMPFEIPNVRFIFLSNSELKDKALLSRMISTEFNPARKELNVMMWQIMNNPSPKSKGNEISIEQRKEIYSFIERNTTDATDGLSLRSLEKGYIYYLDDQTTWKEMLLDELRTNELKEVVLDISRRELTKIEQVKEFKERTGYNKTKYFEIKKELGLTRGYEKR